MDATEIIIKYAVPAVLNKVLGGPTAVITGYHKAHFVILAKALQESSRDKDIQDQLEAITENLKKIKTYGSALLDAIPAKPEAPEGDMSALGDPEFHKRVEEFGNGVTNSSQPSRLSLTPRKTSPRGPRQSWPRWKRT